MSTKTMNLFPMWGEGLDAEYGRGAAAYVRHGFDPLSGRPPEDANPQGTS